MNDIVNDTYCPMPDCHEMVGLTWTHCLAPLDPAVLYGEVPVPTVESAYTSSWQVECMAGHVLLLPGDTGCECDDQDGDDCPHGTGDQYDWSEDCRTFRAHDVVRLRAVFSALLGCAS